VSKISDPYNKAFSNFIMLAILIIFTCGCATPSSRVKMIKYMERIKLNKQATVNKLWYCGTRNDFHHFVFQWKVRLLGGAKSFIVPRHQMKIAKEYPKPKPQWSKPLNKQSRAPTCNTKISAIANEWGASFLSAKKRGWIAMCKNGRTVSRYILDKGYCEKAIVIK